MIKIGIIGGGQLGQMLGHAGQSLDIECIFLDPSENPPAQTVGRVIRCAFDDTAGLQELVSSVDVLTYEFENVPVGTVESVAGDIKVYPPPDALRFAQDRLTEKQLFQELKIPIAAFITVDSESDLVVAADEIGLPLVLKTRRLGYDGKGQIVIRDRDSLADAWSILGSSPLIAEEMIAFDVEASAIGARNIAGEIISYPLTRNEHKEGILQTSRAPFGNAELTRLAQTYHARLADRLDYVGVLSLELFVVGDKLLANEFAPRVHNSGHWTIDGAVTSQFENHLRAVSDMPLADPSATGHVAMENLIGSLPVGLQAIRDAGFYVHEYGKAERPGRKLGHVTLVADNDSDRELRLKELRQIMFS